MLPASDLSVENGDGANPSHVPSSPSSVLSAEHSAEFNCRLAGLGFVSESVCEPDQQPQENRLAVNVVLALSRARGSALSAE